MDKIQKKIYYNLHVLYVVNQDILHKTPPIFSQDNLPCGNSIESTKGMSQGGVISLFLMNLFVHYAFDMWIQREIKLKNRKDLLEYMVKKSIVLSVYNLKIHGKTSNIVYHKPAFRYIM